MYMLGTYVILCYKILNMATFLLLFYVLAYLHDIVDILLFLLMPPEDFRSRPLRFLVREIIVTKIIVPALDKLSDPLYVNYLIVWLVSLQFFCIL